MIRTLTTARQFAEQSFKHKLTTNTRTSFKAVLLTCRRSWVIITSRSNIPKSNLWTNVIVQDVDKFLVEAVEWFLTTFLCVPRERNNGWTSSFKDCCESFRFAVGTKNSLNWSQLNKANHKNAYSIQFWSYVINSFMHHHTTLKLKICSTKTTIKSTIVPPENHNFLLSLYN